MCNSVYSLTKGPKHRCFHHCWQVHRLRNGPLHVLAVYCLTMVDALGINTSLQHGCALGRLRRLVHWPDICLCHGLIHRICSPWYAPVSVFFFWFLGIMQFLLCYCCLSCQLVCPFIQYSDIYQLSGLMFDLIHWGVWSIFLFYLFPSLSWRKSSSNMLYLHVFISFLGLFK